ncbi:MotA/TolQ/ExbB proton channel family protein [Pararhodobacter oceanensis]|uniref:Flagellar motor protein MotA n=1 Tax=Pararhodobacter oceanensis TaxID=2172121 RepID=A0A2T8HXL7_9RHOB|nr:MotA/TolQ/ExbB proton channel family protein [Pararhodobacter oceanensis]PVH30171.1 flagellar motor protein MotA [Pararhodobacter oceanensis]
MTARYDVIEALFARGGPILMLLAGLSVLTMAVILWKALALAASGAFSRRPVARAAAAYAQGDRAAAIAVAQGAAVGKTVLRAAIDLRERLPQGKAREEVERIAREALDAQRGGLRLLELIGTLAPLLGLLGTVLGMIAAFQGLEDAGSRADPALLAGGIWEALLTTAAGMGVAIPALAAHSWFESVLDRLTASIESAATRVFTAP